jgi:His Kinase A (phospho-acceptor) domain
MRNLRRERWKDYAFLGILALFCAIISFLQLRWTGELTRSEFAQITENQKTASRMLVREFDQALADSISLLKPDASECSVSEMEAKLAEWHRQGALQVFKRVAIAIPQSKKVTLSVATLPSLHLSESDWPAGWTDLKQNLSAKAKAMDVFPYEDATGLLMEYPVFGSSAEGDGVPEQGWVILELDRTLLNQWLDRLCKKHLDAGGQNHLKVQVTLKNGETLFTRGPGGDLGKICSLTFHPTTLLGGGPPDDGAWKLDVSRPVNGLEKLVRANQKRNLTLAFLVNLLILAAGYALTRNARKQRQVADAQIQFVANISHELRTPVTVILGAGHNLKRGIIQKPEAIQRYGELILQHGQQLSQMIEEVLTFSACLHSASILHPQTLDLSQLVRQALEDAALDTRGIKIEISIPPDLPSLIPNPTNKVTS